MNTGDREEIEGVEVSDPRAAFDEILHSLRDLEHDTRPVEELPRGYLGLLPVEQAKRGMRLAYALRHQIVSLSKEIIARVYHGESLDLTEDEFERDVKRNALERMVHYWNLLLQLGIDPEDKAQFMKDAGQEIAECHYFVNLWPKVLGSTPYGLDLDSELAKFKQLPHTARLAGLNDVAGEISKLLRRYVAEQNPAIDVAIQLHKNAIALLQEDRRLLSYWLGAPPYAVNNSKRRFQGFSAKLPGIGRAIGFLEERLTQIQMIAQLKNGGVDYKKSAELAREVMGDHGQG